MFKTVKGKDKWVGIAPLCSTFRKNIPVGKDGKVLSALEKLKMCKYSFRRRQKEKDTLGAMG